MTTIARRATRKSFLRNMFRRKPSVAQTVNFAISSDNLYTEASAGHVMGLVVAVFAAR